MPQIGTAQSTTVHYSPSGFLSRFLTLFAIITLIVFGILLIIPVMIILIVLGLGLLLYLKVRSIFARAHKPNGPLDGRHNVRVIDRDE